MTWILSKAFVNSLSLPEREEGTPRVTTENNHRANRLRAIGNGQVPQAVTLAWKMLSEGL